MAPLQKRALFGLVLGIVWFIAIVVVFIANGGVSTFSENTGFRLILMVVFAGGLIANFFVMRKPGIVDERDKLIMGRAPNIQLLAVFITLVVWSQGLTQFYREEGQIPISFPDLILYSLFIVNVLAQSVGILVGYWRINRNG
ncbi:MAG: hypothetical protein KAJ19_15880 [Gammaproteobacteria bacterium]|nr:hypothetical protein [Gammaproteobacteria bacterium]